MSCSTVTMITGNLTIPRAQLPKEVHSRFPVQVDIEQNDIHLDLIEHGQRLSEVLRLHNMVLILRFNLMICRSVISSSQPVREVLSVLSCTPAIFIKTKPQRTRRTQRVSYIVYYTLQAIPQMD